MIGTALSCVGWRGLALRRPFMIRGLWFTSAVAAGVASIATAFFVVFTPWERGWLFLTYWSWPASMLAIAALAMFRMQGYVGFGMSSAVFREALMSSLRTLGIEYSESLSAIELPRLGLKIDVSVDDVLGTVRLRAPKPDGWRVLDQLARVMNRHFRTTRPAMSFISCASYTAFGTGLLGIVAFFLFIG
jgi:hypothetical protein